VTDLGQATPHAGGPGVPIGPPPGAWPAPTMPPPPPGWYWQAVPQERSTLGRRALICALVSIAAPVAALLVIAVAPRASYHSGAQLSVVIARVVVLGLALASPVLAVLGLVFRLERDVPALRPAGRGHRRSRDLHRLADDRARADRGHHRVDAELTLSSAWCPAGRRDPRDPRVRGWTPCGGRASAAQSRPRSPRRVPR
jgi:hypothetical protein